MSRKIENLFEKRQKQHTTKAQIFSTQTLHTSQKNTRTRKRQHRIGIKIAVIYSLTLIKSRSFIVLNLMQAVAHKRQVNGWLLFFNLKARIINKMKTKIRIVHERASVWKQVSDWMCELQKKYTIKTIPTTTITTSPAAKTKINGFSLSYFALRIFSRFIAYVTWSMCIVLGIIKWGNLFINYFDIRAMQTKQIPKQRAAWKQRL